MKEIISFKKDSVYIYIYIYIYVNSVEIGIIS